VHKKYVPSGRWQNKTRKCDVRVHWLSPPLFSKAVLDRHTPECTSNPPKAVKYPDPEDCTLKFQAYKKQFRLPFYLVSDFESFMSPVEDDDAYYDRGTRVIDKHRVCGFACHRVTDIVEYQTEPVVYSGPDPMSVFYNHVMKESKIIGEILKNHKDMLPLTNEQQTEYDAATHCTACGTDFSETTKFVTTAMSAAIFYFLRVTIAIYS